MPIYYYHCFGIKLASEIQIPAIPSLKNPIKPDVTVRYGKVTDKLNNAEFSSNHLAEYQAEDKKMLLKMGDKLKFLCCQGTEIIVEAGADVTHELQGIYLQADPLSVILQQRGLLVLHGSAIKVAENKCIVFVAPSGYGKSTAAAALHQRNYQILSDDLCLVSFKDERPYATPSFPRIRLMDDAVETLGFDQKNLHKPLPKAKNVLRIKTANACEIQEIFVLDKSAAVERITFENLYGASKLHALVDNSFRREYLRCQGLEPAWLQKLGKLAASVEVNKITRPIDGIWVKEIVHIAELRLPITKKTC